MSVAGPSDESLALSSASLDPRFTPIDEGERNPVFGSLVSGDTDIVGLVAYSIYKQNKLDWLHAFAQARGREPDEAELFAYIVGESTSRRLATYRLLAQATLEGKGPDVHVGEARGGSWISSGTRAAGLGGIHLVGYAATAVVVLLLVLIAAHFGAFGH